MLRFLLTTSTFEKLSVKTSSEFLQCAKFHLLLLPCAGCRHRITERLRLEGTSRGPLVQLPPAQAGSHRSGCPGPHPDIFWISWRRETPPPLRPISSSDQISRSYIHVWLSGRQIWDRGSKRPGPPPPLPCFCGLCPVTPYPGTAACYGYPQLWLFLYLSPILYESLKVILSPHSQNIYKLTCSENTVSLF